MVKLSKKENKDLKESKKEYLYAEMLSTLMKEDGLNIEGAQKVLSEYYNITEKELRSILLSNKDTKNFAFNYLFWDKENNKWFTKFLMKKVLDEIKDKFSDLKDENGDTLYDLLESFLRKVQRNEKSKYIA